jgi:hypothetical protein
MGKQLWAANTETALTNELMRAYFGNSAGTGHTHDGIDNDGSVPKINLAAAAHVTGALPLANIDWDTIHTVNMTVIGKSKTFDIYYAMLIPGTVLLYVPGVQEAGLSGAATFIQAAPTTGYALPDALIPYLTPHETLLYHSIACTCFATTSGDHRTGRAGFIYDNGTPGSGHPDVFGVTQNGDTPAAGIDGWAAFSAFYLIGTR